MIRRRASHRIQVGNVTVGGAANVVVQSMTKTDTRNAQATIEQIERLADCGCEIVRLAVPDMEAAEALAEIKHRTQIPLIADIHFDYVAADFSLPYAVVARITIEAASMGGEMGQ